MRLCPDCQKEIPDDAFICPHCGSGRPIDEMRPDDIERMALAQTNAEIEKLEDQRKASVVAGYTIGALSAIGTAAFVVISWDELGGFHPERWGPKTMAYAVMGLFLAGGATIWARARQHDGDDDSGDSPA